MPIDFNDFQQSHCDDILRPGVFGLILFGCMVKDFSVERCRTGIGMVMIDSLIASPTSILKEKS
jgi:hypothetical protein